ncbi:uncharacterized protein LOC144109469 isoform X2 [Amblyomma americanum]
MASQRYDCCCSAWCSALGKSAGAGHARHFCTYSGVAICPFCYGPIQPYPQLYAGPPYNQRFDPIPGIVNPALKDPSSDALVSSTWGIPPPAHASECLDLSMPRCKDVESALSCDASQEAERPVAISKLAGQIGARQAGGHVDYDSAATSAVHDGLLSFGPTSPACPVSASSEEVPPLLKALKELSLADVAGSPARASVFACEDAAESEHAEATLEKTPPETSPARWPASTERTRTLPGGPAVALSAIDSPQQSSTTSRHDAVRGRRRKATPRKSPNADEPGFKGAVVHMKLLITGGRPQLRMEHCVYKPGQQRRRVLEKCNESSNSEDDYMFRRRERKQCPSCATKTTPLWRVVKGGTQLCNACGIRKCLEGLPG